LKPVSKYPLGLESCPCPARGHNLRPASAPIGFNICGYKDVCYPLPSLLDIVRWIDLGVLNCYVGRHRGCVTATSLRGWAYHNILLRPSGPQLTESKLHYLINPCLNLRLYSCPICLLISSWKARIFFRLVLPCFLDESCMICLQPKQLSMGPRQCRGFIQGVWESLTPLLAHRSPFKARMLLLWHLLLL